MRALGYTIIVALGFVGGFFMERETARLAVIHMEMIR